MKAARIYQRVSTEEQNLERQNALIEKAKAEDYYIAGVYKEKASGVRADRPVLNQLIADLQEGDVIITEHRPHQPFAFDRSGKTGRSHPRKRCVPVHSRHNRPEPNPYRFQNCQNRFGQHTNHAAQNCPTNGQRRL